MKRSRLAHLAFLVAVAIKGVDGIIETLLGLLIAVFGSEKLFLLVMRFTTPELRENPGDHVSHAIQSGAAHINSGSRFAVFYLLTHGILKAAIAINLLRGRRWIYIPAFLILGGFVIYLSYLTIRHWSGWTLAFALFDLLTLALVLNEWRQPTDPRR